MGGGLSVHGSPGAPLMFGLTTAALLWGVLFGAIGSGYFIYGKKQGEPIEMLAGAGLVGMTFVVTSSLWIVVLGLLLCLLPWLWRRLT